MAKRQANRGRKGRGKAEEEKTPDNRELPHAARIGPTEQPEADHPETKPEDQKEKPDARQESGSA